MSDLISRQDVVNHYDCKDKYGTFTNFQSILEFVNSLPSAEPEQRYTKEELMVFKHGISLSLLSKRSSQHWQYDEDTAIEIKFLERLYEKVGADMRGEQDG